MTPDQYCQEMLHKSGSSFSLSFIFLDPPQRQAITALYAFCRQVDDIADDCRDPQVAEASLNWWGDEIERLYLGQASHPIGLALQQALQFVPLRREWLHDIITGVRQDLHQTRYTNRTELEQYCYYVAGAVGLLSTQIFGYEDPQTLEYAKALGQALQMTNILRDVREDARRGRIYLPQDALLQSGVHEQQLLSGESSAQLHALLTEQVQYTQELYRQAYALLPAAERPRQRAALIMAAIYEDLLRRIAKDPSRVMQQRLSVPALRKLWLAWRTARAAVK